MSIYFNVIYIEEVIIMTANIYIPISFIIIGFLLNKYTPNHRNYILGYKSPIFMKNKDGVSIK